MTKTFSVLNKLISFTSSLLISVSTFALTGGGSGDALNKYTQNGGTPTTQASLGINCTVYKPSALNGNHPVIVWGNGTGTTPIAYASLLSHWASWGFVVVAANTTNAGTGTDMINCLDAIYQSQGNNLNDKVGTSGHSQGAGGSIMAGTDSRVDATAPIQPYVTAFWHNPSSNSRQSGPMLLLSGSADTIAVPAFQQSPVYNTINMPVFWATSVGASHFDPGFDGGNYRGITTAWFLYQLKNDTDAASLFEGANCDLCNLSGWTVQKKGL